MLRHACGFKLANDGHDTRALQYYLWRENIQHAVLLMRNTNPLSACNAIPGTPASLNACQNSGTSASLSTRSRLTVALRSTPRFNNQFSGG
jgi:hypothetical protein